MKYQPVYFLLAIILSACSSLTLDTDYDKSIDFSKFKTYRWHMENEHNQASVKFLNDIMDQRIRDTIDKDLQMKNFVLKDSGPVDFFVNYTVTIQNRTQVNTYNMYNGFYPGYYFYGPGVGMGYGDTNVQVVYYQQGTLVIDILDPETDRLMWRGSADGRLPNSTDRQTNDELIDKYVNKILSKFPPKESSK